MLYMKREEKASHWQFNCEICVWREKLLKSWNERRDNNDREAHGCIRENQFFFAFPKVLNCQKKRTPTETDRDERHTHKINLKEHQWRCDGHATLSLSLWALLSLSLCGRYSLSLCERYTLSLSLWALLSLSLWAPWEEAAAFWSLILLRFYASIQRRPQILIHIRVRLQLYGLVLVAMLYAIKLHSRIQEQPQEEKNDWLVCWGRKSRSLRALFLLWGGGDPKKKTEWASNSAYLVHLWTWLSWRGKSKLPNEPPLEHCVKQQAIIGRFPCFPAGSLLFPRQTHQVQRCIWIKWMRMCMWEWESVSGKFIFGMD